MKLSVDNVSADQSYALVFVCCGYESRSRYMAETKPITADRRIAFGYGDFEELAFAENAEFYARDGYELHTVKDTEFLGHVRALLESVSSDRPISVLLDISCFTRIRLAQILQALCEQRAYVLDVFYSLAEFSEPPEHEPPNEHLCPVTSYFAGWTGEAERAVGLISGLGYEQQRALGVIEHIDPFETWLFFPESSISLYDSAVRDANKLLLREIPPSNVVPYPVMDAAVLLRKLLSLVAVVRNDYRCTLMPLGPKIFAFAGLLAGCVYRDVSVWRSSSGKFSAPRDRKASKFFSEFRVIWNSRSKLAEAAYSQIGRDAATHETGDP